MDNGKLRIDNIFNGKTFFSIPDYQRSYAWEEKQLDDFFEDYMNNYNSQEYYYGTILLQMTKKDKKEFCDIVDGQQRFTTLIIFMRCLISRLSSMNYDETNMLYKHFIKNGDLYILTLQADDNDFFSTVILDGKKASKTKTPAQNRLLYAKNYFENKIKSCSDEQIEELLDRVCSTNVLIYLIQDSIEAAMIFETTNDRGKSLTNLEKTKSFLSACGTKSGAEPVILYQNFHAFARAAGKFRERLTIISLPPASLFPETVINYRAVRKIFDCREV